MAMIDFIFQLFQIPIAFLATMFSANLIQWLKAKTEKLNIANTQDKQDKYLTLLQNTITNCVITTNQTYVETLKQQGKFDTEAQKIAFQQTYNAVLAVLDNETKNYLQEITNDLSQFLTMQIESAVNKNKK